MTYEELLIEAEQKGYIVKEKPLESADGRIYNNRIAIRKGLETEAEKACILAEELGHGETTSGNIIYEDTFYQEGKAREWAYNKLASLSRIVEAFRAGCRSRYEIAHHLGVTEEFLLDALVDYGQRLPGYVEVDGALVNVSLDGSITVINMVS